MARESCPMPEWEALIARARQGQQQGKIRVVGLMGQLPLADQAEPEANTPAVSRMRQAADAVLWTEPTAETLQHIEQLLASLHAAVEADRALAAILFTDFVDSTKRLAALGDRAWRDLLDSHDVLARTVVEQHRGRLVRTTGDGILATFDGPGRAIRCAVALNDVLRPLGLEIRAGLHTGEIELRGTDIAGIGVHIAARVVEAAEGGELLVSGAVPMLVAGSGFEFDDRGEHELKGVPGAWQLFAVRP
jgi:class 3 adenylate cyclase